MEQPKDEKEEISSSSILRSKYFILTLAIGLVILLFVFVGLTRFGHTYSEERQQVDSQRAYTEWAVNLIAGNPSTCDYMTDEAVQVYIDSQALPDDVKAAGCEVVIPIVSKGLDMREPYEPYKIVKGLNDAVTRVETEDNKTFIWSKDFNSGEQPIVMVLDDNRWLVDAQSFE